MATNNDTAAKDGVKVKVQKLGSFCWDDHAEYCWIYCLGNHHCTIY